MEGGPDQLSRGSSSRRMPLRPKVGVESCTAYRYQFLQTDLIAYGGGGGCHSPLTINNVMSLRTIRTGNNPHANRPHRARVSVVSSAAHAEQLSAFKALIDTSSTESVVEMRPCDHGNGLFTTSSVRKGDVSSPVRQSAWNQWGIVIQTCYLDGRAL
jgi:hypothetical protein